jgi:hypothetical protein
MRDIRLISHLLQVPELIDSHDNRSSDPLETLNDAVSRAHKYGWGTGGNKKRTSKDTRSMDGSECSRERGIRCD